MNMCTELVAFTVSETFVKNGPLDSLDPDFCFSRIFCGIQKRGSIEVYRTLFGGLWEHPDVRDGGVYRGL